VVAGERFQLLFKPLAYGARPSLSLVNQEKMKSGQTDFSRGWQESGIQAYLIMKSKQKPPCTVKSLQ